MLSLLCLRSIDGLEPTPMQAISACRRSRFRKVCFQRSREMSWTQSDLTSDDGAWRMYVPPLVLFRNQISKRFPQSPTVSVRPRSEVWHMKAMQLRKTQINVHMRRLTISQPFRFFFNYPNISINRTHLLSCCFCRHTCHDRKCCASFCLVPAALQRERRDEGTSCGHGWRETPPASEAFPAPVSSPASRNIHMLTLVHAHPLHDLQRRSLTNCMFTTLDLNYNNCIRNLWLNWCLWLVFRKTYITISQAIHGKKIVAVAKLKSHHFHCRLRKEDANNIDYGCLLSIVSISTYQWDYTWSTSICDTKWTIKKIHSHNVGFVFIQIGVF